MTCGWVLTADVPCGAPTSAPLSWANRPGLEPLIERRFGLVGPHTASVFAAKSSDHLDEGLNHGAAGSERAWFDDVTNGQTDVRAVTDNLFELDQRPYQEIALYFLIEFAPGSTVLDRDGPFEGNEPGTVFQWIPLDAVEQANLFPTLLQPRVKAIPPTTEYVVHPNVLH